MFSVQNYTVEDHIRMLGRQATVRDTLTIFQRALSIQETFFKPELIRDLVAIRAAELGYELTPMGRVIQSSAPGMK